MRGSSPRLAISRPVPFFVGSALFTGGGTSLGKEYTMIVVDPPEGWRFGFPKPCPEYFSEGFDFDEWIVAQGYPRELMERYGDHFTCRTWESNPFSF